MRGNADDLLRLPPRERAALASSLEAVARLLRGELQFRPLRHADELLAHDLLPAWWLELGGDAVGVADLFSVDSQTKLGALIAELIDDAGGSVQRAKSRLGHALSRLEKSGGQFAGYRVRNWGTCSGSQTWACQPIDPPEPLAPAGAD